MPETQVVVRALLGSDPRFVQTHDNNWSVVGSSLLRQKLDRATFAVVDLETTGSVIGVDEIIELGVVVVRKGQIIDRFETLVWTDRTVPPWVSRLTGIKDEDLVGAPTFSDITETLHRLLDGNVFVAHDIRFDLPFMRWEFARRGLTPPAVTGLCTLELSRLMWPDLVSRSLLDLSRHFEIDHISPHRASDDAAAAAGVLMRALDEAAARGLGELGDLFRLDAFKVTDTDDEDFLAAGAAES